SSVHAFTTGTIGYFFLGFIAVVLVSALVMVAGVSDRLKTVGHFDSPASRETVFLLNNLFLTVFMFTVLTGTLFPLVAELVRGVKVSVGEPFFNKMSLPVIVVLLFLMGVGPALPWKAATSAEVKNKLLPPLAGALVLTLIALAMGIHNVYGVLAFACTGYAIVANLREFYIGAAARRNAHGEGWALALTRLIGANRRRYGGYISHLGVFLVALGIAASSSLRTEREATLEPGQSVTLAGRTARLKSVWGREEPQRSVIGATLEIMNGDKVTGKVEPRMNFYPMSQQPVPTPQVHSYLTGDLYANLQAFQQQGKNATVKLIWEPLVPWIWFGGGVVILGAIVGIWPNRRRSVA
ncbi:MAG: heme lyase CcmF/NrfE family subunit, partial [Gemmatimonadetes bacterium]|nr:heme lyase CcmF/NrfE family subunit [Gemmatimonadota bacterium]